MHEIYVGLRPRASGSRSTCTPSIDLNPSPQPAPTRGEGAHRQRCGIVATSSSEHWPSTAPHRHCLRQTQSVCARERKRRARPEAARYSLQDHSTTTVANMTPLKLSLIQISETTRLG